MKIKVTLMLFSLCILSLKAQEENTNSRVEFTSVSLFIGALTTSEGFSSNLGQFKKLAPNSDVLNKDFLNFDRGEYYQTTNVGPAFSAAAYFKIKNKSGGVSKYNPHFRIGITYANQTLMSQKFYESNAYRIDTLISNQTGQSYFVDSVESESYYMEYSREQVYINGAFLLSSNPSNRFKVYAGLGFSIGLSFNSRTSINYSKDNYLNSGVPLRNNYNFPNSGRYSDEVYYNDEGLMALVSIPFGAEMRLSTKENAWAHCRFFFEANPSVSFVSIPELGSNVFSAGIWGGGFKYDF